MTKYKIPSLTALVSSLYSFVASPIIMDRLFLLRVKLLKKRAQRLSTKHPNAKISVFVEMNGNCYGFQSANQQVPSASQMRSPSLRNDRQREQSTSCMLQWLWRCAMVFLILGSREHQYTALQSSLPRIALGT